MSARLALISVTVSTCLLPISAPGEPVSVRLEELDLSRMTTDWGKPRAGRSAGNHPLRLGGRQYERGVGVRAESDFLVDLKGGARTFRATVGVDDEVSTRGSVTFEVWVDGRKCADTGIMRGRQAPKELAVDLLGARRMRLRATSAGDGGEYDHADWAEARIELNDAVLTAG